MDLKSMTLQEMQEYMESIGEKKFRAKQIYEWFHKHLALSLDEMNNVPKKLKEKIEQTQEIYGVKPVDCFISKIDGTRKYLFELYDGNIIESVLMIINMEILSVFHLRQGAVWDVSFVHLRLED